MTKRKILVVDDEPSIREFLAQILSADYQIILAKSGTEAVEKAQSQKPSLILLDILMPGMTGVEVCKHLRNDSNTKLIPIIMLTALNEPEQRTQAFLAGADDYISKPFKPDELLARIKSKVRRLDEAPSSLSALLKFGDLELDLQEAKVEIAGNPLDIGHIELKILKCLLSHRGQLVERNILNQYVWGDEAPSYRALDPHITTLRKKLRASRGELKTVYGRGYSLVMKEGSAS